VGDSHVAEQPVTHVKRDRVSLAAGAALVLIALLSIIFAREAAFNHDEFYFLDAAKTLALQGKYATVANGQLNVFDPYISTGPTVIGPIALLFWIWRPGYFTARLIMVVFFVALFLLLYRVASTLFGRATALLTCAFVLCVPLVWFLGLHVLGEVPGIVLFLIAVQFLLKAERPPSWARCYLLAGLFLGLAALTKLIFFLGVAALGGLAVLVMFHNRRHALAMAGGVVIGVAILVGWEVLQVLTIGPAAYVEVKGDFYDMFTRESGVKAWFGAADPLADAFTFVRSNFRVLDDLWKGLSLAALLLIVVVLFELRRLVQARQHTRVHVFFGLFLGSYVAWFFFTKHDPFYRLLFPAYLLGGMYVASSLVAAAATFRQPVAIGRKLASGVVTTGVFVALFAVPFYWNAAEFLKMHREQPAWRNLRMIKAMQEQVPGDAKIGYWGWWRAPEVSFFLPNQFVDISIPDQRNGLVPGHDFIIATATQQRQDPISWENQRRFCQEQLVVRGRNKLCRYGLGFAQAPAAPSARLDFMGKTPVREDQLTDGFYRTPEPPPRWVASPARFFIGTSGTQGRLRLLFDVPTYLSPTDPNPVTVAVSVNDAPIARLQFNTPGSKSVMTDCVSLDSPAQAVRVELTTNRSFVPRQIGLNTDTRVLALQLRDVEFHPEHACAAPATSAKSKNGR
jgi:4-amino-4-deoxy-L-arabinose transferase-like glycosyltransferase